MRFQFTRHAVERYIKRIDPTLSYTEARSVLESHADLAVRTKTKTCKGQEQFVIHELKCILVCKFDLNAMKQSRTYTVVVTILPVQEELNEEWALSQEEVFTIAAIAETKPSVAAAALAGEFPESYAPHTEMCCDSIAASEKAFNAFERLRKTIQTAKDFDEDNIRSPLLKKLAGKDEQIIQLERSAREAQNALRIAIRGLFGEIPAAQALEAIAMLKMAFIEDSFYKNATTVFELAESAENHEDRSCI